MNCFWLIWLWLTFPSIILDVWFLPAYGACFQAIDLFCGVGDETSIVHRIATVPSRFRFRARVKLKYRTLLIVLEGAQEMASRHQKHPPLNVAISLSFLGSKDVVFFVRALISFCYRISHVSYPNSSCSTETYFGISAGSNM